MQEIKLNEICKECGCGNEFRETDIRTLFWTSPDGEEYRILYFVCKSCGNPIVVQVDDDLSLKLFETLRGLVIKAAQKNHACKEVPKKWIGKKNALNARLTSRRKSLMNELSGTEIIDQDKNIKIII